MINKKQFIEKREILKSNKLIEGSYRFTTSENRLIDLALSKLEVEMLDKNLSAEEVTVLIKKAQFHEMEVYVTDYKKEYDVKNNTIYTELAESADRLLKRQLVYREGNKLIKKNWLITCVFKEEDNSVSIQFHPDLIADLLVFKGCYTRFDFDIRKYIKSFYTCRIYELLKQYEPFGRRTFELENLRFLLGLEKNEYALWGNFNQRILKPAIIQLNKVTDLYIECETDGIKNKVETITFKFSKQKLQFQNRDQLGIFDNISSIPENLDYNIIEEFRSILGFTVGVKQIDKFIKDASKAIEEYHLNISPKEYIVQKKIVVDKYALTHEVPSYIGAIVKAIQKNWTIVFKPKPVDSFNDYPQNNYNFPDLEKKLLGWDNEVAIDKDEDTDYTSITKSSLL